MSIAQRLVGSWQLVTMGSRDSQGRSLADYDRGLLHYFSSGRMSVQVCDSRRPSFGGKDWFGATEAELRSAFNGFVAYFGRYEVDEQAGIVIHHVEGSLFPNWIGKEQRRFYKLEDRRLTLSITPSTVADPEAVATLVWERID